MPLASWFLVLILGGDYDVVVIPMQTEATCRAAAAQAKDQLNRQIYATVRAAACIKGRLE